MQMQRLRRLHPPVPGEAEGGEAGAGCSRFSVEETSPLVWGMPRRRPVQEAEAAGGLSQPIPARLVCLQQSRLQGPRRDKSLGSPTPARFLWGFALTIPHTKAYRLLAGVQEKQLLHRKARAAQKDAVASTSCPPAPRG